MGILNANPLLEQFMGYHTTPLNQPCVSQNEGGVWEAYVIFTESHSKWWPGIAAQEGPGWIVNLVEKWGSIFKVSFKDSSFG